MSHWGCLRALASRFHDVVLSPSKARATVVCAVEADADITGEMAVAAEGAGAFSGDAFAARASARASAQVRFLLFIIVSKNVSFLVTAANLGNFSKYHTVFDTKRHFG